MAAVFLKHFFGKKGHLRYTISMLNIYQQENKTGETEPAPQKARSSIRDYQDPTGEFDNKQLKYGMWWLTHRTLLERALVVFIIALAAIFWLFSLWRWGEFFLNWDKHSQLVTSLSRFPNYAATQAARDPEALAIASTELVPSGVGKSDAVAEVINPNSHFLVQFDYYFVVGGQMTKKYRTFLLPGEDRIITVLGLDQDQYGGSAELRLENVDWQRVSQHSVTDPVSWQKERLNFEVTKFVFNSQEIAELGVHRVAFSYVNNSGYSYVNPVFYVGLYQREVLVGILPLSFSEFKSLETKEVDVRTYVKNIEVDSVRVYPAINLYDSSVYLLPE